MNEIEKILENCVENLRGGRAVATGIGLFLAIFTTDGRGRKKEILLRRRMEKQSIHKKDLSGKLELPGGGVDMDDFPKGPTTYRQVIFNTVSRELLEETGFKIDFSSLATAVSIPALLREEGIIDIASVVVIHASALIPTKESEEKLRREEILWVPVKNMNAVDIVSPYIRFLVNQAIENGEKM